MCPRHTTRRLKLAIAETIHVLFGTLISFHIFIWTHFSLKRWVIREEYALLSLCVERIIINQVCLNEKPSDSLQASVCDDLVRISEIPMALTKKQFLTLWE